MTRDRGEREGSSGIAIESREAPRTAPLRILHVLDNLDIGGTELNAVRTAEQLDRSRFALSFACLRDEGPLRARLDAAGIPVRRLRVRGLATPSAVRSGWALLRLIRRERIDVVHAHDPYANVLAAPWARLATGPAVIVSQRWWRTVHPSRVRVANRMAYGFAHCVLVNSPAIGEMLVREERVPQQRIAVIPNFVESQAFQPLTAERREYWRRTFGIPGDAVSVGIIANLHPVKNHGLLLRAMARLRDMSPALRAVLVGDGRQRAALEAEARALGLAERVHFAGRVPHEPGLPGIFDIAVLCSREEGFPNAVVEAMAAGRPVIATAVGGTVDAVSPGETGLLVPSDDDAAMAEALRQLVSDPARRERMGAAGRQRAAARFEACVVLEELGALYQRLVQSRTA